VSIPPAGPTTILVENAQAAIKGLLFPMDSVQKTRLEMDVLSSLRLDDALDAELGSISKWDSAFKLIRNAPDLTSPQGPAVAATVDTRCSTGDARFRKSMNNSRWKTVLPTTKVTCACSASRDTIFHTTPAMT
jgi:hypothetical protein